MTEEPFEETLTADQEQRIECAKTAREVLLGEKGAFAGTGGPDVSDVIRLAEWLQIGVDPYDRPRVPVETVDCDSIRGKTVWIDGFGIRVVEDTYLPDGPGPEYDMAMGDEGR